jgi:hypothetical protein
MHRSRESGQSLDCLSLVRVRVSAKPSGWLSLAAVSALAPEGRSFCRWFSLPNTPETSANWAAASLALDKIGFVTVHWFDLDSGPAPDMRGLIKRGGGQHK